MTILQQRQYNRFARSSKFLDKHESEFSSGSRALALRDELKDVLGSFHAAGQERKSSGTGSRSQASAKLTALNALRGALVAIANTAEVIEKSNPKFKNTFKLPDRRRKEELANAARQFIKDAQPVKGEFLALEMRDDFLDELQRRIDDYEAAKSETGRGQQAGKRQVSNDALGNLLTRGAQAMEVLDVIVKNKYSDQPPVMNEWSEASKLEFTPRRKKGERAAAKK
ncbi:MAG: hypothetical protein KY445_11035 [Armatimonadetes bacterium]|nr:hypothetical protein [Armatimonadota bacterium]